MPIRNLLVFAIVMSFLAGCQSWRPDRMPPTASLPQVSEPGTVEVRYWQDLNIRNVESLVGLEAYPDNPDEVTALNQLQSPIDQGNNYGSLVRGFIIPPTGGSYRFYVTGDNETQFWLSENEKPADAVMVAIMPGAASPEEYDKYSSQTSPAIELAAETRYYFEIRHIERSGGDHFAVAWEGPGFSRRIIGGDSIASLGQSPYDQGGEASEEDVKNAYALGYRIGFFDGTQSLRFNAEYPPMDMDQDGLYDNWETYYGLDPNDPTDTNLDQDNDLLTALDEFWLGSDPTNSDTDGDGIPDGVEFANQLNPLDASDARGDLDGDGATNLEEYRANTAMDEPTENGQIVTPEPGNEESFAPATNQVTLSWSAPLTRTDGTSISPGEIQSYQIAYGQDPGQLTETAIVDGTETSTTITNLEPGTWYFAIRTIDNDDIPSALSDSVAYEVK